MGFVTDSLTCVGGKNKHMHDTYFKAGLTVGITIGIPLGIASGIFLGTLLTRLIEHSDWEKALKKHREEITKNL